MNGLKTTMLLAALTAPFGSLDSMFGGTGGALIALMATGVLVVAFAAMIVQVAISRTLDPVRRLS